MIFRVFLFATFITVLLAPAAFAGAAGVLAVTAGTDSVTAVSPDQSSQDDEKARDRFAENRESVSFAAATPPVSGIISIDTRIFRLLNTRMTNPVFDYLMPYITDLENWKIILLLVWCSLVIFGKSKGRWAALMLIPLVAASDQICTSLIKPAVGRMRPCEVLGGVHLYTGTGGWIVTPQEVIGGYKSSFSFPSNHAANITSAFLFLGLVYRRWLPLLLLCAAAVSYSRVYVGVHWPSDIIVGAALGTMLGFFAWVLFNKITGSGSREKKNDI